MNRSKHRKLKQPQESLSVYVQS